ncbi:MAG TPA: ABC transporter substrate-binding protein [Candidatus Polarisedimenticolia bacterium]|nr:ABC transporter substrate-binding protein [Candidatus Polarisedimenticolia bacterium]
MRRILRTASTAILSLALGCGAPPIDHAEGGRTRFVYPMRIEPSTLSFVSLDAYAVRVNRLIGDALIDHDADLEVVPRLARAWEFSPDGRVLTFHLRPGVRFHDGTPLSSADVRFTYERVLDPECHAVGRLDAFLSVERVEAPDPLTVRVTYRAPYAPALRAWEVPILPAHLYGGGGCADSPLNRAPIGSGPFRFLSWEAGQRIVLEANADYWGGRPAIDQFLFQIIPSQETSLQALLAGEVDYSLLTPEQWEAHGARASFARRFATLRYTPLFHYYIAWRGDGSNRLFADPAVRRALTLALDRQGYVRSVLRGLGEVASSPFHPGVAGAGEALPTIPYDRAAAAALLDGAGWRLDPESGLRTSNGVPFRFELLVYAGGRDHLQFSQVAQENLREIGIDMTIQRLDWQALLTRLRSGDFQAALSGVEPGLDPDSVYGMLHSSQIDGGQNYAALRDDLVDRLLEEGRRTLDPAAREALYRRLAERVRELEPYSFLFYPAVEGALARHVAGVQASPQGILGWYPGAGAFRIVPVGP